VILIEEEIQALEILHEWNMSRSSKTKISWAKH